MALQFVIPKKSVEAISRQLGDIASQCEIFPMSADYVGLSVPKKVVESLGEAHVRERLTGLNYYDLYKGQWVVRE
jgi:hypothetical protein